MGKESNCRHSTPPQLLTYLKLGGYKVGLLLNFNTPRLKNGIKRIVNGL